MLTDLQHNFLRNTAASELCISTSCAK